MSNERIVRRNEKVSFMDIGNGEFKRMKYFTAFEEEKNSEEYSRKYTDESFERVDVVGISSGVSFTLDQRLNDPVHEVIVDIFDKDKLGEDSIVTIVSVDFTKELETEGPGKTFEAKKRTFSLIPGSEGGQAEAYSYSGTLRTQSETEYGVAIFTEDKPNSQLENCTFE